MIDIGIITTTGRNTLRTSLPSLRYAGYHRKVIIYAEPGAYRINDPNYNIYHNGEQLGCFKNYHHALSHICEESKSEYVSILSDDFIYNKHTFRILEEKLSELNEFGFVALFTPQGNKQHLNSKGWQTVNKGWGNMWGGLYVFKRETAKQIIAHPRYQDHLKNYEKNQQIDHLIPEVCFQLGLDQHYRSPSLSDHIGYNSTIGHRHTPNEKGLKFVK